MDDPGVLEPDHPFVVADKAGFVGEILLPVLDSITPNSCPAGPPDDVTLVASGSGFSDGAMIAFGNFPNGTPRYEQTTHEPDGTLSTIITAGLFPGVDPDIPVLVDNAPPGGPRSDVLSFAIT
jgi:hypothetical protein